MKFYFVRHGETEHNRIGKLQGHYDIALNETGKKQAQNLEPIVRTLDAKKLYHSPLKRAHETANIINQNKNLEMIANPHLKEWDIGAWENTCVHEFRKNIETSVEPPNGETKAQYNERVDRCINSILDKEKETFLIVAHGGVFIAMVKSLQAETNLFHIDNCALVVFEKSYEMWRAYVYA